MRIKSSFRKILRHGGGMFLGVKVHFPIKIWDGVSECGHIASMTEYTSMQVSFGFGAWQLNLDFRYNVTPINS